MDGHFEPVADGAAWWDAGRPIRELLPIRMPNGSSFSGLGITCRACGTSITDENIRGVETRMLPTVASLELLGQCLRCRIFTRLLFRVRCEGEDLAVDWLEYNGRWESHFLKCHKPIPPLGPILKRAVSRLFRQQDKSSA